MPVSFEYSPTKWLIRLCAHRANVCPAVQTTKMSITRYTVVITFVTYGVC